MVHILQNTKIFGRVKQKYKTKNKLVENWDMKLVCPLKTMRFLLEHFCHMSSENKQKSQKDQLHIPLTVNFYKYEVISKFVYLKTVISTKALRTLQACYYKPEQAIEK